MNNNNGRGRGIPWVGDQTLSKDEQTNRFNSPQLVNPNGRPIGAWDTSYDKSKYAAWQFRQFLAPPATSLEVGILSGWIIFGAFTKYFMMLTLKNFAVVSAPTVLAVVCLIVLPAVMFLTAIVNGAPSIKGGSALKGSLWILGMVVL